MLLSLLITVAIMGGLGALVLGGTGTSSLSIPTTAAVPTTGSGTTGSTQSVESEAERVACVQDANDLASAVSDYELVTGATIGVETGITVGEPSTYGTGREAYAVLNSNYLSSWPTGQGFALSLSTVSAGQVAVYVPATSRHPVLFEKESSTTGCNAL